MYKNTLISCNFKRIKYQFIPTAIPFKIIIYFHYLLQIFFQSSNHICNWQSAEFSTHTLVILIMISSIWVSGEGCN